MAAWTVFEPPGTAPGTFAASDKAAFVKEGWSWGAFFLAPLWLLWRRMWLIFLVWLAVMVIILTARVIFHVPRSATETFAILFTLWFSLEANGLRRWSLARRGWRDVGLATGSSLVEAEQRFFAREGRFAPDAGAPEPGPGTGRSPRPAALVAHGFGEAVLGVFPEPHGGSLPGGGSI